MTNHVTTYIEPIVKALENTMTSKLKEFMIMNPPIFVVSKVREDPKKVS